MFLTPYQDDSRSYNPQNLGFIFIFILLFLLPMNNLTADLNLTKLLTLLRISSV